MAPLPGSGIREVDASRVDLFVWLGGPGSTPGASLPTGQGLNCPEEHMPICTTEAAPASCVFSAGVGWRLRKGGRGQSPGIAQKWGQEGPPGGGVDLLPPPASPGGPAAGSAVAAASPHLCLVIRPPTVCWVSAGARWGRNVCLCGAHVLIRKR